MILKLAWAALVAGSGCGGGGRHDAGGAQDAAGQDRGPTSGDGAAGDDAAAADGARDENAQPDGAGGGTDAGGGDAGAGVPRLGHVWVIVMENHGLTPIRGNKAAPYLNGLMRAHAIATNYRGVTHPSLPNYLALTSGGTQGVTCDCQPAGVPACQSTCADTCACPRKVAHVGDQLDDAGITWRQYGEGMGAPCGTATRTAAHYAPRHVPFTYYDDVRTDAARCQDRVRDFSDFAADLAADARRVSFISPNLCNDMHDTCGGDAVAHGDAWLAAQVPAILDAPAFKKDGALFIVFDEDDGSGAPAPVPFVLVSPFEKPRGSTAAAYDHYALLATIEDALGLARLGKAAQRRPIDDLWR